MEKIDKKNKGGRPKLEENEKYGSSIGIRFSVDDRSTITKRAKAAGLSYSEYVRQAALKGTVKRKLTPEEVQLARDLSGMANNINQLMRRFWSFGEKMNVFELTNLNEQANEALNKINKTLTKIDS